MPRQNYKKKSTKLGPGAAPTKEGEIEVTKNVTNAMHLKQL